MEFSERSEFNCYHIRIETTTVGYNSETGNDQSPEIWELSDSWKSLEFCELLEFHSIQNSRIIGILKVSVFWSI